VAFVFVQLASELISAITLITLIGKRDSVKLMFKFLKLEKIKWIMIKTSNAAKIC
jgi:hypothetical protein